MITTYLQMLNSSLLRKKDLLEQILNLTIKQNESFQDPEHTIEIMEQCVSQKEPLIAKLNELDAGFDTVYQRIKEYVVKGKKEYQQEIEQLQATILIVTEIGARIQSMEQNNKMKFDVFSKEKRQEIKQFKMSNKTVASYYKNMTGKTQGESYFIDKKK